MANQSITERLIIVIIIFLYHNDHKIYMRYSLKRFKFFLNKILVYIHLIVNLKGLNNFFFKY